MRIGLNGLFWPQERTGSGQYTRQLWYGLQALPEAADHQFQLLMDEPVGAGSALRFVQPQNASLSAKPPQLVARAGRKIQKVWWEQWGVTGLANRQNASGQPFDLIHYPYFAAPLIRPNKPTALVVTIHDLIPLALPEYAADTANRLYYRLVTAAARQADLILADSAHSKKDILRFLKVDPAKVAVVYLGTHAGYRPGVLPDEQRHVLLQKYGLRGDERVIFYIGGYDVRKNVPMLLEAFAAALPRLNELENDDKGGAWTLALAGKPHTDNPAMFPDVRGLAQRLLGTGEDARRIHFMGAVDEADKPLLYRAAEIFVFPSRYEGFGLDPLDALASGIPTICADATCLPEVMGAAARLVLPGDKTGWTRAISELAANPALRAELAQRGPLQAAKFTWEKTARRTFELYQMLECVATRTG